jgi:CRISPR/Cas system-associated protein endoribonuclease Cas2
MSLLIQLDFWSMWFYINPTFMIALGIFTFAVSVYGFLISNQENRCVPPVSRVDKERPNKIKITRVEVGERSSAVYLSIYLTISCHLVFSIVNDLPRCKS